MSRYTEATYVVVEGRTKGGRPVVCLTSPMRYEVLFLGSGWVVDAPIDYCTDLASLPVIREAWLEHPRWGRFWRWVKARRDWIAGKLARASIPHDRLREDQRWPKWVGDYVFWEAMGVDRVPAWLRLLATVVVLFNFSRH